MNFHKFFGLIMDWISSPIIILLIIYIHCVLCEFNLKNNVDNNNKNFKSVPTTIKTYENDTVLLPCYQNVEQQRYVRWHRDDLLLVDSRHPEIPAPERYHLWGNGSLQVSNVNSDDTGEYYCEVMGQNGQHAVQLHAIEVQYPPMIISSPSGLIELPIGAVFEIICEAKGIPHPVITWRQNGLDIIPTTDNIVNRKRILIEVESRDIAGPIECIADNGIGEPAIDGIHLNVLFTPEVTVNIPTVHTKINMRVHLECITISAPAANVHWFHHGVPILPDSRIARHDIEIQSNYSLKHYITESRHQLIIKNVRDHDLGIYECRAENKIGFKGLIIELTGRPMACVFKVSPAVQTGTGHNLIWQTESLSPIVEFKLKFRQVPSGNVTPQNRVLVAQTFNELTIPADYSDGPIHTTSYSLRGLQPASVYEVAVLARNRFGWSDNSKIIRFATGGEIELNYSTESMYSNSAEIDENFITDRLPNVNQFISKSQSISTATFSNSFSIFLCLSLINIKNCLI